MHVSEDAKVRILSRKREQKRDKSTRFCNYRICVLIIAPLPSPGDLAEILAEEFKQDQAAKFKVINGCDLNIFCVFLARTASYISNRLATTTGTLASKNKGLTWTFKQQEEKEPNAPPDTEQEIADLISARATVAGTVLFQPFDPIA